MKIRTLSGDDEINAALNAAMSATILHLVSDCALTSEQGKSFLDHHVCILATQDGGLSEFIKRIFSGDGMDKARILVLEHRVG